MTIMRHIEPYMFYFDESADDEVAPAVVGAVVAVAGLGYTVLKDILGNKGDIQWNISGMEGAKYPWDDKDRYHNKGTWKRKTFNVKKSVTNYIRDEISATFKVEWWYNGYAVGYVTIVPKNANDAVGWGLNVKSRISVDPNTYKTSSGSHYSIITLRFTYRFDRSIGSDVIKTARYRLRGTGRRS